MEPGINGWADEWQNAQSGNNGLDKTEKQTAIYAFAPNIHAESRLTEPLPD